MVKLQSLDPTKLTVVGFNLEVADKKYNDKGLCWGNGRFKYEGATLSVTSKASVTTDGLRENTFEEKTTYSIGVDFQDASFKGLETLKESLEGVLSEFEIANLFKSDDIVYLKHNTEKEFNDISSTVSTDVSRGDNVTITANISFYVNLKTKKAGLVMKPTSYIFDV